MSEFNVRPLVRHVALAFAASAVAFGMAGCGKSEGGTTGGTTTQITAPKGTIVGSVVDNQGNPLAGVKVTIGNKTLTTTDAGTYEFDNIAVNTSTYNGTSNGVPTHQFFTVVLQPPSGYLGATVTVTAAAQCVAGCTQSPAGNSGSTTGDVSLSLGGGGTSVTNPQTIFVDGYTASAGTTVLPALNATVSGTLRDGVSGAIAAGVPLYAQLVSVNAGSAGTSTYSANVVNYATGVNTPIAGGQTGADGTFSVTGLAADSCYSFYSLSFNLSFSSAHYVSQQSDVSEGCSSSDSESSSSSSAAVQNVLVSTNNSPVGLNQIYETVSPNADVIRPWVASVDEVINQYADPGLLNSSVSNTLVVHFSEAMKYTASASNPITVLVGSGANLTTVAVTSAVLAADGNSLTLTLASSLPTGSQVLVNLPIESFTDLAGNLLNDHHAPQTRQPYVDYDGLTGTGDTIDQLVLNTFTPGNTDTGTFTVSQKFDAQNSGDHAYAFSNVLGDVVGSAASTACSVSSNFVSTGCTTNTVASTGAGLLTVNQLNALEAYAPANLRYPLGSGNLVEDELSSLLNVVTGSNPIFPALPAFPPDAQSVNTNVARVTITLDSPAQVADLALTVTDSLGNTKSALYFPVNSAGGPNAPVAEGPVETGLGLGTPTKAAPNTSTSETPVITDNGNGWYGINPKGNSSFDVIIVGQGGDTVVPGDLLHVVSRASPTSGTYVVSQGQVLTLKDEVDPTTTLNILAGTSDASGSGASGQGGVIYQGAVAGTPGMMIFPVTPQLADTSDTNDSGPANTYTSNSFDQELFQPSGLKAAGATDTFGTEGSSNALRADTDATGVNAFLTATTGGANNVPSGLAVSETVSVTGTPAYNGSAATLSSYGAAANVESKNYNFGNRYNDLVTFTISNIFDLAADGRSNSVIDLTGAITDAAGNVAAAGDNAKALVQDLFPPLMTLAYTDGTNYVFTFNEPVQLYGSISLDLCGASTDLHADAIASTPTATLSSDGKTVTVQAGAFTGGSGSCFYPSSDTTHTYAESLYTTANTGVTSIPATLQHGPVSFQNVPDSVGNIWANTNKGTPAPNESGKTPWSNRYLGMGSPRFAMVSLVGPLAISTSAPNFNVSQTNFQVIISGNQPLLNLLQPTVAAAPGPVANPALAAIFTVPTITNGFGVNSCAGTDYTNADCKTFIDGALSFSACTPTTGTTAAVSSTGVTFTVVCSAAVADGDTVTITGAANQFESQVVDPNTSLNLSQSVGTAGNIAVFTAH